MTLLKNIIFTTIFLLFSFKFSKGQETAWPGELAITETTITEDTPIEEVPITETVPVGWSEETTTTRQEAPWYEGEITTTEDTPIEEVLVEEPVEEGSQGEEEGSEGEEEGCESEEEGQIVEEPFGETATTVGETTTTEAPYEWSEETITERSPGETENPEDPFEEDQPEEGDIVEEAPLECRNEIEEITVHGYIMTMSPCCVSSKAECDNTYEPVCFNKVSVDNGEWTETYETVNNVCNACKGNSELSWYSNGKCPWENGDKRPCQKNRRLRNN